jgi:hypothetical protein
MSLIDALKFVQGAVAKKHPLPILTHFSIREKLVKGYNGAITICSPIPLDLDCQPKAAQFVKAIQSCEDTVSLSLTATGKLTVKSDRFRVHVECSPEPFPDAVPTGEAYVLEPGLVEKLKVLEQLIAEDASRPWARSIMLKDQCLFVTNNIVVVQYWIGHTLPIPICISHAVVNELIRIKQDPIGLQCDDQSVTFHYPEGRWLKAALVLDPWPDIERVLNRDCNPKPIPDDFFAALSTLSPFANDLRDMWFTEYGVTTSLTDGDGASRTITGFDGGYGWYDIDVFRLLEGLVDEIDFHNYPAPVLFFGKDRALRGAIVGRKDANYPPNS